ncbi:GNAT family N-acetyltransferase [Variovorax sp. LjRoot84]|uniref:GNAT family N-acetyltransferase n=1 Tax=Variovorax sp. LjRoot84 TaxID=3342340 RepID=UPI003ED0546F
MQVRMLEPYEPNLQRELRLRALRDSPNAFRDTYAEISARPPSYWEELTRSVTELGDVMFLACEAPMVVGSVYGFADRTNSHVGRLGGMWVDPAWRRRGVGNALLNEVIGWSRKPGCERLRLWSVVASPGPSALYQNAGFVATGKEEPLASASMLRVVEMELVL